jgi:hypothetical protein
LITILTAHQERIPPRQHLINEENAMPLHLEYHAHMRYGTLLLAVLLVVFFSFSASAQANGVPPSVTSFGFGGHPGFNGVAPSVTSVGPRGAVPQHPVHPHPFQPQTGGQPGHHRTHDGNNGHHHDGNNGSVYYVPYFVPYYPATDYDGSVADEAPPQDVRDSYEGGPTIFDRRGSGERAANDYVDERPRAVVPRPPAPAAAPRDSENVPAATAARVADPPAPESVVPVQPTILIFKDGHKQQISNYAIVGANLYDLTPGRRQKVPIADLDLVATQKANDDEGNDFKLPQLPGN